MKEEPSVQYPSRGFGTVRRLAYIGVAQQLLLEGVTDREVVTSIMDEGITEMKASDYVQVAKSRIARGLPMPEATTPMFDRDEYMRRMHQKRAPTD